MEEYAGIRGEKGDATERLKKEGISAKESLEGAIECAKGC